MDSYVDALHGLAGIVERYDQQIAAATNRAERRQLTTSRDAVAAALDELRAEDTSDVPAAVWQLVDWLTGTMPAVGVGMLPPHAGSSPVRSTSDRGGHCRACAVVGHLVAHPDRDCRDVGCIGTVDPEVTVRLSASPADGWGGGDPSQGPIFPD